MLAATEEAPHHRLSLDLTYTSQLHEITTNIASDSADVNVAKATRPNRTRTRQDREASEKSTASGREVLGRLEHGLWIRSGQRQHSTQRGRRQTGQTPSAMAQRQGSSNAVAGSILLVVHDFIARSPDELSLAKGDRIELFERYAPLPTPTLRHMCETCR